MSFEEHLKVLIFFHLQEHTSAQHLLQVLEEDDFARSEIAPQGGIKKSSFSEATNTRRLDQFMFIFEQVQKQASRVLPNCHPELGKLVAIDGSFIDATLSMQWADYRKEAKKAKTHIRFDLNRGIPQKIFFTNGNGAERPFVSQILSPEETVVMDRGYQCHERFDLWQKEENLFMCRIKAKTTKTVIESHPVAPNSIVFYDATVLLGTAGINRTEQSLRLVGYEVDNAKYWIATNRYNLSAEQVAGAYKLRWDIETFFAWWKRYLKVYHLIARSEHGLMVQILAGLITYQLHAIYCHEQHKEKVSIKRVRLYLQVQKLCIISKNRMIKTYMQKLNRKLVKHFMRLLRNCVPRNDSEGRRDCMRLLRYARNDNVWSAMTMGALCKPPISSKAEDFESDLASAIGG